MMMFKLSAPLLATLLYLSSPALASNPKRGIAFSETNGDDVGKAQNSQISWVYVWRSSPPAFLQNSGLEFVPMQWGSSGVDQFQSIVTGLGAKTILGFNEPDKNTESNLSPDTAAAYWRQYIQPLHDQGVRLGAPVVSAGTSGTNWFISFLRACAGCTFDFVPLHWYGDDSQSFVEYVQEFHGQFDLPIWVTEWASTSSDPNAILQFLKNTTSFLDSTSYVERYSWFSFARVGPTALLNSDGSLNALGQAYVQN